MGTLLKVFQQVFWQGLGKVVTATSTIIILGLISRNYGEEGVGIITLGLTFIAFFVVAVDFGINAHVLDRFLKGGFEIEWRKLLGFRVVLSLVLIALGFFLIIAWPKKELTFFKFVYFGLIFAILQAAIFNSANVIFQAKHRYDLSVISSSLGAVINLGAIYLIVKYGLGLDQIVWGYVLGGTATFIVALILTKVFIRNILPIVDFDYIKNILSSAWPISATLALNVVYFRIDSFLIAFFKGFLDVGIYNLAYMLFQAILVLPTFIMNAFYPLMIKVFRTRKGFEQYTLKISLLMLGVGIVSAVILYTLSPIFINLLSGGSGFLGSVDALRILAFSLPAFFVSSVLMWTMVTIKKYKIMLFVYLAGLLINLFLNYLLIPTYSYIGASWVTVASEYLILGAQVVILWPLLRRFKHEFNN